MTKVKSELQCNLIDLESTRDSFLNQIESMKIELVNEKAALPDLESKLVKSLEENVTLTRQMTQLGDKYNEKSAEMDSKNTLIAENTEKIDSLAADLAKVSDEKEKLVADNSRLLNEVSSCHVELENFNKKLDELNSKLTNQKAAYDELHEKHEELLEDEIKKIEELEALSLACENNEGELRESEVKLEILETSNTQLQRELADYREVKQKFTENDREVNQLIVIKSELEEKIEVLEMANAQQERKLKKMETELEIKERGVLEKDSLVNQLEAQFVNLTKDFNEKDLLGRHFKHLYGHQRS